MAKVTLIAHLGRDPETKYLPDGTAVCTFSVATSRKRKDQETTLWWRISVFGRSAEACQQYLVKGAQVFIEGEPRVNEYTDRSGEKRWQLECVASDIQFIGARTTDIGQSASGAAMRAQAPTASGIEFTGADSDDVPF